MSAVGLLAMGPLMCRLPSLSLSLPYVVGRAQIYNERVYDLLRDPYKACNVILNVILPVLM